MSSNDTPPTSGLSRANVVRGCGRTRTPGGVYLEVGLSPDGLPLEHFLIDPPLPYTPDVKRGVSFVQDPTTLLWHIIDHVGAEHYPYASDILEEGRLHGFSRRINNNLIEPHFGKLTPQSRLILLHPRAIVRNTTQIQPHLPEHRLKHRCAHSARSRDEAHLHDPNISCTRYWYALTPADRVNRHQNGEDVAERALTIDTAYPVEPLPLETPPPNYASGIIAQLPITNISVITDPNGSHSSTLDRLNTSISTTDIPITERPL